MVWKKNAQCMALSFFCTFGFGASSVTIGARHITAIYGHCDVLQGTEGAPQRPQISRSVDKKSLHDMIGKFFALENEPTLSLVNCQMPDFAHAAVFNSHHRPNESLINLHWSILTAPRTFVAS